MSTIVPVDEIPSISKPGTGDRESKSSRLVQEFLNSGADAAMVDLDAEDRGFKAVVGSLRQWLKGHAVGVGLKTREGTDVYLYRTDNGEAPTEAE